MNGRAKRVQKPSGLEDKTKKPNAVGIQPRRGFVIY